MATIDSLTAGRLGVALLAPLALCCAAAVADLPEPTGDPSSSSLLPRAERFFEAGEYGRAADLFEQFLEANPERTEVRVRLAWARYRSGDFAAAGREFETVLGARADHHDARVGLGYVRLQSESPAAAAATFRALLTGHPEDRDALRGMVLAGLRGGADPALAAEAARAAATLERLDPADREAFHQRVTLEARAGGPVERRLREPLPASTPLEVPARAAKDYLQVRGPDGAWRNLFVKGFNLGTALPGRFPTQFPTDTATYREWLGMMADLGANAVRLYTLLPPAFYRALAEHNAAPGARRIYLIQGVWTELPPRHDFSDPGFVAEFQAEIARVIDAVHGNLVLAARPGHASGVYEVDASENLLAYVIGREWEPFAVVDYTALRPGETSWRGRWLEVRDAGPMEVWVARMCEFAVEHEVSGYRVLHPVTFANWPTLDPLHHPTEGNRAEEDAWRARHGVERYASLREAPWEDDRITLDSTKIVPTPAMEAGFFASYHIYPNYPDFMNLEPAYAAARDALGPNRYLGYLRALEAYHGDQPLLVAEFGISTSRGVAHVQPLGWHHGGLDERDQGDLVARMLRNIHDAGYAGGIVFSFLDEWFKGTWSVAPFEEPAERRRLWFNAESPEQSYGVLAARPASAAVRVDGDPAEWTGTAPYLGRDAAGGGSWSTLRELRATSDEGYLYLLLRTAGGPGPPDWSRTAYRIALDTYAADRGETALPEPGAARVPTGVEFLIDLAGPGRSFVRVTAPYEPYAAIEGGPLVSPRRGAGEFVPLMFETNRERFGRDGTRYPPVRIDRGVLRYGSLDPASPDFDTRADVAYLAGTGAIELRIPWGLINVADPSTRRVLHHEATRGAPFEATETAGIRIYAFALDRAGRKTRVADRLPAEGETAPPYTWRPWNEPRYRLELKRGADRIRDEMNALPDTFGGG